MDRPPERTSSSTCSGRLQIRWTTLAELWNFGVEDKLARHAEEAPSGFPLDPDWPQFRRMERQGLFRVIGAFTPGCKLAGYNAFFVMPTMQHRSTVRAINEALYLEPDHRKGLAGARLIVSAEARLRALGAKQIVYHSHPDLKGDGSPARLARLLSRLGYAHVESAHAKSL